jgi:iron complex outermembrane receptor protein
MPAQTNTRVRQTVQPDTNQTNATASPAALQAHRQSCTQRRFTRRPVAFAVSVVVCGIALSVADPQTAMAQQAAQQTAGARQSYNIQAGPLAPALRSLASRANLLLTFTANQTDGKTTAGVSGQYTPQGALATLLTGTGLHAVQLDNGGYVLRSEPVAPAATKDGEAVLPAVTVRATSESLNDLPTPYAGGQVARGSKLGILGNRDFLDTPFSTTAYTSKLIADQNAKTVADVLQNDPSVRYTTPIGHMVENFYIRGFLVTADNMAMNGLYGVAPYDHVPTEFIERVEILKGPSALVNGMSPNGAVGGTINLIPKRAEDKPTSRIGVDFESGSQIGTHLDIGRRFGEDQAFGVRFNGAYRDGDTELDEQSKTRQFGALALDYRGRTVSLNLDVYDSTEKTDNGSPMMVSFANGVIAAPDSSTNLFKGTYSTMRNRGIMLRGEADINDHLGVYAAVGTRQNEYDGYINGTRANNVRADGSYTGWTAHQSGYNDTSTYEVGARSRFDTGPVHHEIVLSATGLALENGTITSFSADFASNIHSPVVALTAPHPGNAPKIGKTTLSGVALADTLSFLDDKVTLTLGLRNQRVEDTSFSSTGAVTADYDKRLTTPAIGLVVKPWSPNIALYANYIEGLTKGDTTPSTAANPNQIFAPYVSKQKEIGVKWDAGSFAHTLALYEITQPSMIRDAATNIYSIDGEKRVRGIEWSVMGQILRDVRLLGGLTLAEGEQMKTANGTNDGKDAYGMPAWQGNLGLEWDLPWIAGLTVSGRVVHTDKQYLNSANTLEIPSWTRVDAGVRYTTAISGRKTTFRANVVNLFDRNYWAGPYHGEGYTTLSAPRTFSLSATVDF